MATLATIRERARVRADQDQSTFPTDAQYNLLINEAAQETWYDLIRCGWPAYVSSASFSTATARFVDDLLVTVPVLMVVGVFRQDGGVWSELRRLPEGSRADMMGATGLASYYELSVSPGDGVVVQVWPAVSGSYLVRYITEFGGFESDPQAWYGPGRSDELIVLRSAAKAMRKEGNDQGAAQLEAEYSALLEKVCTQASWLDGRNAATVRDVRPFQPVRMPGDYDIY